MTLYSPLQAVNNIFEAWILSSPPLPSRQVNMADMADMADITASPGYLKGWIIFKMTAVALGPKSLSRIRIQGS